MAVTGGAGLAETGSKRQPGAGRRLGLIPRRAAAMVEYVCQRYDKTGKQRCGQCSVGVQHGTFDILTAPQFQKRSGVRAWVKNPIFLYTRFGVELTLADEVTATVSGEYFDHDVGCALDHAVAHCGRAASQDDDKVWGQEDAAFQRQGNDNVVKQIGWRIIEFIKVSVEVTTYLELQKLVTSPRSGHYV